MKYKWSSFGRNPNASALGFMAAISAAVKRV